MVPGWRSRHDGKLYYVLGFAYDTAGGLRIHVLEVTGHKPPQLPLHQLTGNGWKRLSQDTFPLAAPPEVTHTGCAVNLCFGQLQRKIADFQAAAR